jgi:hypothetical protein
MQVNVHGSNACKRALNVKKTVLDWLTLMIDSNVFAFKSFLTLYCPIIHVMFGSCKMLNTPYKLCGCQCDALRDPHMVLPQV